MSEPASISTGIAARYATAVFELAKDSKSLSSLEQDVEGGLGLFARQRAVDGGGDQWLQTVAHAGTGTRSRNFFKSL